MSQIEPHADLRQLATLHRQMFIAWTGAGFTEAQAIDLLRAMIRGNK
jgi:hypothetical protein